MLLFFFKQKTAYEMRISDWSSDVCSSDLRIPGDAAVNAARLGTAAERRNIGARPDRGVDAGAVLGDGIAGDGDGRAGFLQRLLLLECLPRLRRAFRHHGRFRSEERRGGKECVSTGRSRWSRYH